MYKKENDSKVKERLLLLIIRVREDGQIPFRVVKEMHRSNPWASDWLKRYDKEDIVEGLKDRTKSSRPPELSEEVSFSIKKELFNSKQGWTTKQVEELIIKWHKISLHPHIPYPSKMGIQTKGAKESTVDTASKKEKISFKKDCQDDCG